MCILHPQIQSLLLSFPHSPPFSMHVSTSRAISRIQIHLQLVRVPDKSERRVKCVRLAQWCHQRWTVTHRLNDTYTNGLMMMCADEYTHVQSYL